MCGHRYHHEPGAARAGGPAEGETVRLADLPRLEGRSCGSFPWWALWMLWPLFWLAKGAAALAAPALAWLGQPLALTVTPLPLLLVALGAAILVAGAIRRRRGE